MTAEDHFKTIDRKAIPNDHRIMERLALIGSYWDGCRVIAAKVCRVVAAKSE